MEQQRTVQGKRIINWIDEILHCASILFSIPVDVMISTGIEIEFPGDVVEIIKKNGVINDGGMLIVTGGVVLITKNDCLSSNVKIKIGKSITHEFGKG